ncbi:G patch domain-containing protein 4-like isoform X2 [Ornithodoros turicata]|uniref:G patch domain-containing protein 4-like isoform X2 n=1 Tax=Ornithodoros turicata TaxID=34597 RepID=UPI00313A442D
MSTGSTGYSFARGILEKHGWKEGQGLGKDEDGIVAPIRPSLKFDTSGLGHRIDLTSDWWCKAFNNAAKSIEVQVSEDCVKVKKNKKELKKEKKTPAVGTYNAFVKAGTQTSSGTFEPEHIGETQSDHDEDGTTMVPKLSDDELFKACGGLTAHSVEQLKDTTIKTDTIISGE